jgi:hypothetical protein
MAGRGRRGGRRGRGGQDNDNEHEGRRDRDREEGGDDPKKHAAIIARRWTGSPPPTLDRYARALGQWRALPGAVVSPTIGVTAEPPAGQAPDGKSKP